ncbi:MAG: hypothetical protein DRJ01_19175, partial [Bacteroidetes bacterium]
TNIDYICNTVYKNNKLDFIITEEGRIKKLENNTLRNEYYIKDIPIAISDFPRVIYFSKLFI